MILVVAPFKTIQKKCRIPYFCHDLMIKDTAMRWKSVFYPSVRHSLTQSERVDLFYNSVISFSLSMFLLGSVSVKSSGAAKKVIISEMFMFNITYTEQILL